MAEASGNHQESEQDIQRKMSDSTEESIENLKALPVFKEPMCLIENDESGIFKINEDVLDQISKIDTTANVIAIAGPYRTGKSYLMNRLAGVKSGFALGKSIQSTTKGIWVWCQFHPINKDQILVLLDTEGIGDTQKKDENNDYNILCLTALLSSTFVYNIIGVINRETLEKLGFITYFAKKIRVYNDRQQDAFTSDIGLYLPKFVLCLRDFSQDLEDQTPDDYLQSRLSLQSLGKEKSDKNFVQIRACIQLFFTNRKCCIFDAPVLGRAKLSQLGKLDDTDISDQFLQDTKVFIDYIYSCQPKQLLDGNMMNGRMFSTLTRHYVEVIKSGHIPCIDDALTCMAEKENLLAAQVAVAVFEEKMKEVKIPISDMSAFEKTYREAQKIGLQEYHSKSVLDTEQKFSRNAEKEMDGIRQKYIDESNEEQRLAFNNALQDIYDTSIKQKILKEEYEVAGGYKQYKDDFAELKSQMYRRFPHADKNVLKLCVLEFEEKYRDREDELLMKAENSREKIKEALKQGEKEKNKIMEDVKATMGVELNEWKSKIEKQRKAELEKIQAQYKESFQKWNVEKEQYQDQLQKQNTDTHNLLSSLQSEIDVHVPSVKGTCLATLANMLPFLGPITFQAGRHFVKNRRARKLAKLVSDAKQDSA